MKRIFLSLFILSSLFSFGQSGTWTWISGDSAANSPGVYGTQGVPSVNNHPPSSYESIEWKDKLGNFWIYGGTYPVKSDLWKYNPVTNEWTWVKGNGKSNDLPVYGTQGVANSSNTPGTRSYCAATWVDTSGALWLFGGADTNGLQNDLWKFDISTNEWTWVKGDSMVNAIGAHGTQGIPSLSNTPGARNETCSAWTDSLNNLWLFGGDGYDDNDYFGSLSDLMEYNIATNEWTWMKGAFIEGVSANYGTKGVAAASNDPGQRWSYTKWKDLKGNFWLMGGGANTELNDVWKYDLSVNEWTWMNGTNASDDPGNYQSNCLFNTINLPYSRLEQRSAVTDNCGRFWLFGGFNYDLFSYDSYNDLWVFDSEQLKWNWLSGTNVPNQTTGNYGALGIASPSNMPGSRLGAIAWWGNDNRFYLFGGAQFDGGYYIYSDVWVFTPDTNCVPVCASSVVPPVANFQSSKTTLCANDCINFTDLSTNATAWQWSFAGAADSTSAAQNPQYVCYSSPGIYNVTLIASNSGGSDTLILNNYVTVNAAPLTPNVHDYPGIGNDTLVCSTDPSYTSYQWYFDSTLVAGATDTFIVVSQSGNYNVQVSNANNCKIAVGINVIIGIQNYVNDNIISIYPNPASEKITIYDSRFTIGNIAIYNVLGQLCGQSKIVNRKSEIEMDVSSFPSGIYFVQVATESGRWAGRFVKE